MVKFSVELVDILYPIGSIYISTNNTNPSLLFGGNWVQIKDKFLLSCGDTYNNGATGGSATVSLTESEMPRHTHLQNAHHHQQFGNYSSGSGSGSGYMYSQNRTTTKVDTADTTATNKYTGGTGTSESASNGSAHENMPPYLAVYVWERVEDTNDGE